MNCTLTWDIGILPRYSTAGSASSRRASCSGFDWRPRQSTAEGAEKCANNNNNNNKSIMTVIKKSTNACYKKIRIHTPALNVSVAI